jgi:hypothetical protein
MVTARLLACQAEAQGITGTVTSTGPGATVAARGRGTCNRGVTVTTSSGRPARGPGPGQLAAPRMELQSRLEVENERRDRFAASGGIE